MKILYVYFILLFGNILPLSAQHFEMLDSLYLSGKQISLYKKYYLPSKNKHSIEEISKFIKANPPKKAFNSNSFANQTGNTVFVVTSKKTNEKENINNIIFGNDGRNHHEYIRFYGKLRIINNKVFSILCRTGISYYTISISKIEFENTIGIFPTFFDSLGLGDWPEPNSLYSEIIVEQTLDLSGFEIINYSNNFLIYTRKELHQFNYFNHLIFSVENKQWFKAKPQTALIETDSTFHLSKGVLKLTEIEKSDTVIEKVNRINKLILKSNCKISKLQAIKEEDNIIFFIEYTKKYKPIFLKYDINDKKWYKVEFEKEEIK
jgi:hypothetical protein